MFNNGKINGYDYEIDEKRIIWFKADQMAEKLGLVQFKKKVKYVRWDTINKFIKDIFPTSWENNVIIDCGNKGSYIPYQLVLRIAIRLNNDTAREFQMELINIVDAINENGIHTNSDLINIGTRAINNLEKEQVQNLLNGDRFNKYAKSVTINQNDFVGTCVDNLIINCGTRGSVTISYPIKNGDYVPYRLVLLIAKMVIRSSRIGKNNYS